MMSTIDQDAAETAFSRMTRKRNRWSDERALAECRRVAELHGCDGEATASEAAERVAAKRSIGRAMRAEARSHRDEIVSRHTGLSAYRITSGDRKSRVFFCRSDERAIKMSDHVRCPRAGITQVVRLLADGRDSLVKVL